VSRLAPRVLRAVIVFALLGPVIAGLAGVLLPAFGYLPALGGTDFDSDSWSALWAEPALWDATLLALLSGFAASAISVFLTFLFLAAGNATLLFRVFERLLAPLVAIPHVALAVGLAYLLAPSGWLVRLISPWLTGWDRPPDFLFPQDPWALSLTLGLVIKETPFLVLVAIATLPQVDSDKRLRMARMLGYRPVAAWLKTVLPALYRRMRLPILAVLAYGISNVEMAIVLGPSIPPTLPVLILQWFQDPALEHRFLASAAAVLQLLLVGLALAVWLAGERLMAFNGRKAAASGRRASLEISAPLLSRGTMLLIAGLSILSLLTLAVWSAAGFWRFPDALPDWRFATWERHGAAILETTLTTALLAFAASLIAFVLSLAVLETESHAPETGRRRGLIVLGTPLLVPQIAFLFGTATLTAWLGWTGNWVAVIWAHLLFVMPYLYLTLADSHRSLDPRYAAVARTLGKGPLRTLLLVKLPLLRGACFLSLAVGVSVSVALYLPTLFIGGGRFVTLATEAVTLSSGGDRRLLAVTAFVQALLPMLVIGLAIALGRNRRLERAP